MFKPDYTGGSIVNLMSSIEKHFQGKPLYKPLKSLPGLKKNVLLIVIDGLGCEYLKSKKNSYLYMCLKGNMTSVFPPTTASAITTYATGLAPKQHAMTGWFMNLKEVGGVSAVLPFVPRVGGLSYEMLGVEKENIFDTKGICERIKAKCITIHPNSIKDSEFNRKYSEEVLGYTCLEGFFRQIKKAMKRKGKKFIYAYWPKFDSLSHEKGNSSEEAAEHFAELDKKISGLKGKDTTIIVTSDHGFIDAEKKIFLENHPKLNEMLSMPLCGEARAAYCYVYPSKVKEFESYVNKKLSKYCWLYTREDMIKENWYGLYKPHQNLLNRIGDYVLLMKNKYVIKDRLLNEEKSEDIGFHGGVSKEEMLVPLVIIE